MLSCLEGYSLTNNNNPKKNKIKLKKKIWKCSVQGLEATEHLSSTTTRAFGKQFPGKGSGPTVYTGFWSSRSFLPKSWAPTLIQTHYAVPSQKACMTTRFLQIEKLRLRERKTRWRSTQVWLAPEIVILNTKDLLNLRQTVHLCSPHLWRKCQRKTSSLFQPQLSL